MCSQKLISSINRVHRFSVLNAFTSVCQPTSSSNISESLPLSGCTFAVKDCYSTSNQLTTCGSKILSNYVPNYDSTVVERLKNNGCELVGKTNLDEFSMGSSSTSNSLMNPVRNPYSLKFFNPKKGINMQDFLSNNWLLAGGSSGGSAVAVACDIVDIGIGSDCGGSVRNPAAYVGVVGFKPTYGLVSRHGLIPLVNSLDSPSFLTKNVKMAAKALDATCGIDLFDPTTRPKPCDSFVKDMKNVNLKGLKIGVAKEFYTTNISSEVANVWNKSLLFLRDAGCEIIDISLPLVPKSIVVYHIIGEAEIASNMARYDGIKYGLGIGESKSYDSFLADNRSGGFGDVVKRRIIAGNYFLLKGNRQRYYEKALKVRRLIHDQFRDAFTKVDAMITPVNCSTAPWYLDYMKNDGGYYRERNDDYFTQAANLAGIPALCLPLELSEIGLPISLQILTSQFRESTIFAVGQHLEESFKFEMLNVDQLID